MTADIVNLRQARKAKKRFEREEQAAENRVKFGQTKEQRQKQRTEVERSVRQLDGHRLTDGNAPDDEKQ